MIENYQIGLKYYNEKQYDKALEYFLLAVDNNEADAQNFLGSMYHYGYGVKKSYQKAVEYYQLAADQGLAIAQYNVGFMYFYHYGSEKSIIMKTIKYFQLAADQGFAKAQFKLGNIYQNGYGVKKSIITAVKYYQLAADQDLLEARRKLDNLKSSNEYIQYAECIEYELLELQKIVEHQNRQIQELKQQNELLELQIKYQPGGSGYQETKEHFESLSA
jgi:TPR repeat protein